MGRIPSLEEARDLVKKYNTDEFHLKHAEIVSGTMGYFGSKMETDKVELWKVVGMLHDLDFGMYPQEHCKKCVDIMESEGYDESLIRACVSHGWIMCVEVEPKSDMEKVLYAVDELTGLIGATALMRPSKSVSDLELKSVKKKFKQPSFAAGCSREAIQRGCDLLGWELDYLIEETIMAMRYYLILWKFRRHNEKGRFDLGRRYGSFCCYACYPKFKGSFYRLYRKS